MTTFAELQALVYDITNKPNLISETTLAIQSATIKLHLLEYWERDMEEKSVSVAPVDGLFQIDTQTNLSSRYRKCMYIQKNSNSAFLTKIGATDLFDNYDRAKTNVFYEIGTKLNCSIDTDETGVLVGFLKTPVVTSAAYSSWIADLYPTIIASEAAAFVFNTIGETTQAQMLKSMQAENLALLKINHLGLI